LRPSFLFSDPQGTKIADLEEARRNGYQVVLIFIGIDSSDTSKQRVSMRVMQEGHDVPDEKLESRFARTITNLDRAIQSFPVVIAFDNSDLSQPYQLESIFLDGECA